MSARFRGFHCNQRASLFDVSHWNECLVNRPLTLPSAASTAIFLFSATSRLLVQSKIYDQVVSSVVDRASRISVGDPMRRGRDAPGPCMGPLVSGPQKEKVLGFVTRVSARNSMLGHRKRYVVAAATVPWLLLCTKSDTRVLRRSPVRDRRMLAGPHLSSCCSPSHSSFIFGVSVNFRARKAAIDSNVYPC